MIHTHDIHTQIICTRNAVSARYWLCTPFFLSLKILFDLSLPFRSLCPPHTWMIPLTADSLLGPFVWVTLLPRHPSDSTHWNEVVPFLSPLHGYRNQQALVRTACCTLHGTGGRRDSCDQGTPCSGGALSWVWVTDLEAKWVTVEQAQQGLEVSAWFSSIFT